VHNRLVDWLRGNWSGLWLFRRPCPVVCLALSVTAIYGVDHNSSRLCYLKELMEGVMLLSAS